MYLLKIKTKYLITINNRMLAHSYAYLNIFECLDFHSLLMIRETCTQIKINKYLIDSIARLFVEQDDVFEKLLKIPPNYHTRIFNWFQCECSKYFPSNPESVPNNFTEDEKNNRLKSNYLLSYIGCASCGNCEASCNGCPGCCGGCGGRGCQNIWGGCDMCKCNKYRVSKVALKLAKNKKYNRIFNWLWSRFNLVDSSNFFTYEHIFDIFRVTKQYKNKNLAIDIMHDVFKRKDFRDVLMYFIKNGETTRRDEKEQKLLLYCIKLLPSFDLYPFDDFDFINLLEMFGKNCNYDAAYILLQKDLYNVKIQNKIKQYIQDKWETKEYNGLIRLLFRRYDIFFEIDSKESLSYWIKILEKQFIKVYAL